jgi:glycoprotein endo-alpha-1,2-mannosidase
VEGTRARSHVAFRRALLTLVLCACLRFASGGGDGDRYLVGAHYYVWYPTNFTQGYLRGIVRPPQPPALGEYDSRDPAIAERHISLAASRGIDFFSLDWWPNRPAQNEAIDRGFLRARNIGEIRFCIFYESSDLGTPEKGGGVVFDAATKNRFVSDMVSLARRYFAHPSYLRWNGRPVLLVYITRELRGLLPQAMREARHALAAEGYDPFVIGDEIFWAVLEANEDPTAAGHVTGEPQITRIRLFDAITAYNLYIHDRPRHRGYGSASNFVQDSVKLYRRYRDAGGVPIVPTVIPGFNDRAHRPALDHFAIPRRWAPDGAEGSFFSESIERIAKPLIDDELRMVLITSWNEWNEDTAIEPLAASPPTADDASDRQFFTQGYAYEGFGTTYVDIVRDRLRH